MKDKYINDIEPMIQNWLKSGNENTTMIAYEIAEYVREQVKLCSIPHVSNRRELLIDFCDKVVWKDKREHIHTDRIDKYLKEGN